MNEPTHEEYKHIIKVLEKEKDQAYWERNQLIVFLSKQHPAHLQRDTGQALHWRNVVCIHLVAGITKTSGLKQINDTKFVKDETLREMQFAWHIHDKELKYFKHLKMRPTHYDGHTTEEKYTNLAKI